MKVYINLILKCLAKRFIEEDANTCSNMHHVPTGSNQSGPRGGGGRGGAGLIKKKISKITKK